MALVRRTRLLLSVLQELGGDISDRRFQNLLFLYCKHGVKRDDYYEFIRYTEGPCSVQAQDDKSSLIRQGILLPTDSWTLVETRIRYAVDLDFFEKIAIQDLKNKWQTESDEDLAGYIDDHFPVAAPHWSEAGFFTIGYEGASPEAYVNALIERGVKVLVDVRKNAFSQKFGFSKSELAHISAQSGIEYRHMPELGIESIKRKALVSQKEFDALFRDYVAQTLPKQTRALDTLRDLVITQKRVAITCFEADRYQCHRRHVAHALKDRSDFPYRIEHLMPCKRVLPRRMSMSF